MKNYEMDAFADGVAAITIYFRDREEHIRATEAASARAEAVAA